MLWEEQQKDHIQTEKLILSIKDKYRIAYYCDNLPPKLTSEICDVCHGSGSTGDGICSSCNGRGLI